jgi:hypothetical protein
VVGAVLSRLRGRYDLLAFALVVAVVELGLLTALRLALPRPLVLQYHALTQSSVYEVVFLSTVALVGGSALVTLLRPVVVPVRRALASTGGGPGPRSVVGVVPRLLAATLLARLVALLVLPAALLVAAVIFVPLTAAEYALYTATPTLRLLVPGTTGVLLVACWVYVAALLAGLPTAGHADAVLGGEAPITAVCDRLRAFRNDPRRAIRSVGTSAAVEPAFLLSAFLVFVPDLPTASNRWLLALLLATAVLGPATAVRAVRRAGRERRAPPERAGPSAARVGAAALLVLALVGGAAAVRVTDTRPTEPATAPAPPGADPATLFDGARTAVRGSNVRVDVTRRAVNTSTGRSHVTYMSTRVVDRRHRTIRIRTHDHETRSGFAVFLGEGVIADTVGESRVTPLDRLAGQWRVVGLPGYAVGNRRTVVETHVPPGDADWTVRSRTDAHIVLVATGEDARHVGASGLSSPNGSVRVTIDPDTGRPQRIERSFRRPSETGIRFDDRITFAYAADGERPPAFGEPDAVELLWDLAYY